MLDLSWLPEEPGFNEKLKTLSQDPDLAWSGLNALAATRLDFLRLGKLDRALMARFGTRPPPSYAYKPVRLAVLGSSTLEHLIPGLRVAALRRGLWLSAYLCGYGQYRQELTDESSGLHRFKPNAVLFALDAAHLTSGISAASTREEAGARAKDRIEELRALWRRARDCFQCHVIQQTILPALPSLMGSAEHRAPGAPRALADRMNAMLREAADHDGADLLALDTKAAEIGLRALHDPVLWHRAKQEISPAAAPLYGDLVLRIIAARLGRSAKALVLDLDNTLWGGVIGDDGLDGIVLGQGSALGEAFVAFQRYAKALSERGIILAVCSKNEEAVASSAFDKHPEMILKRQDIACFMANWQDKPANLRIIAERLNIGLDALVFADDNPFERNIIRRELPMVMVPELPEDPSLYAQCLADAGYFEAVALTSEDRTRGGLYQAEQARQSLRSSSTDLEGYLRSLDMELKWRRFDKLGLQRIVQLVNKTNQFNLTTQRYTEAGIAAIMEDESAIGLQLRLIDKFSDNGMIAVLIGRLTGETCDIETWLMSCRVLGRGVEQASLNVLAAEARRLGAKRLTGEYRPTPKNGMVREHYAKLGFDRRGGEENGVTRWALPLESFVPYETFIRITEERL